MKEKSESEVAQSCRTLATPWTAAYQAPPSMGFSRQDYWSGVLLPSPNSILKEMSILIFNKKFISEAEMEKREKKRDCYAKCVCTCVYMLTCMGEGNGTPLQYFFL